jgi:hypothetical protein
MRRLLLLVGLFSVSVLAIAQDRIGEVVFVDGDPRFVRDGIELAEEVSFGYPVENFDTITTDARSELEIAIDPDTGIDVSILVDPDTTFYLDLSSYRQQQRGVVELITGSINVNARQIRSGSGFLINTPTAAMGVRGTVFSVDTAPGGEMLVTPQEGVVEVTTTNGQRGFARTGQAVEIDTIDLTLRTVRFSPGERQAFREQWGADRRAQVAERAPELVQRLGRQYRQYKNRFVASYGALMRRRDILDQWMEQARRGTRGDSETTSQQIRQIAPVLLELRGGIRAFEQLFARLETLREYLPTGSGSVEIESGFTIADVYRMIGSDRAVMQQRFREVRHALKLFAVRNNGVVPRSILGEQSGVGDQ